jgi:hypothetical protein
MRGCHQEARGHSSAGRASALQAGGRRFDPDWLQVKGKGEGREKQCTQDSFLENKKAVFCALDESDVL